MCAASAARIPGNGSLQVRFPEVDQPAAKTGSSEAPKVSVEAKTKGVVRRAFLQRTPVSPSQGVGSHDIKIPEDKKADKPAENTETEAPKPSEEENPIIAVKRTFSPRINRETQKSTYHSTPSPSQRQAMIAKLIEEKK